MRDIEALLRTTVDHTKKINDAYAEAVRAAYKIDDRLPHGQHYRDAAYQYRTQALEAVRRGDQRELESNVRSLQSLAEEIKREHR